jgi:pimeloyl-ACP methyl ester carboxylesterase
VPVGPDAPDAPDVPEVVTYPGARPPDRVRSVDAHGVRLAVHEWGYADAPPLGLVHGGFDFARTFDVFAPLLADAGWRVVAWDQRGHGDSDYAELYSWETDVRDAVAVLDSIGTAPLPVVGHSKGGSLMLQLASGLAHRVSHVVNLDGLPTRRAIPDVPDHQRTKLMADELASWLDIRRRTVDAIRKPGTLDELAARRGRMNPRLSKEWLRYLVSVGGRHDADGWRWKIDPTMRMGGFGPWRPEWAMRRLATLGQPVLAILGMEPEVMGWGTRPEDAERDMPPGGRLVVLETAGHFVHIEQPKVVADLVLEFLPDPTTGAPGLAGPVGHAGGSGTSTESSESRETESTETVTLRHNRIDLALHRLRNGTGRPLLLLHGLAERSPALVPDYAAAWPGPVWALDFTGHGESTIPAGGGYFAEILMGDADAALAHLGPCTVFGRGLGGYVALLVAGARPDLVRGAILDDGPGLSGGGTEPGTTYIQTEPLGAPGPPDPYALLELSRDVRPPDYAATFSRQAATLSGLDVAIAVVGNVRPPWLAAVAAEPGVQEMTRPQAVELFAAVP